MEDKFYYAVAGAVLFGMALTRTLKDLYDKKLKGLLGFLSGLMVSVMGGVVLGMFISIFTDEQKWQWLGVAIGSWAGVKSLDLITEFIHDKFMKK